MEASRMGRSVFATLAILSIMAVVAAEKMTQPEPAHAQVALPAIALEEGLTYAIFGSTGAALIYHAVNHSDAVHKAHQVIRHPHRFPHTIKWAHQNQARGQKMWHRAGESMRGVFHWFRRHYTLQHMKNRGPGAAIACIVSGLYTWAVTQKFHQGLVSCGGAAIGVFGVPGAKRSVPIPAGVRAELGRLYPSLVR